MVFAMLGLHLVHHWKFFGRASLFRPSKSTLMSVLIETAIISIFGILVSFLEKNLLRKGCSTVKRECTLQYSDVCSEPFTSVVATFIVITAVFQHFSEEDEQVV